MASLFSLLVMGGLAYLFFKLIQNANFTTSKGQAGEDLVRRYIEKLAENEAYQISALHDLYIPKSDGTTSQIDNVMVTETKNYGGWIYGSEKAPYWTQTFQNHKQKFKNPLHQNYGHIESLKSFLGEKFADIPYYSVVVFTNRSELKFREPFRNSDVIHPEDLKRVVDQYQSDVLPLFSQQEIRVRLKVLERRDQENIKEVQQAHI
ncbi:nuclease-related domain-containing protein [Guptibacillus hwajinpoensis]|uniref:nuclease-related domain-containing protein n=1 Tax=Guptibacillus hwajinpoensis TaxID=208199 RepID=UPI0037353ECD